MTQSWSKRGLPTLYFNARFHVTMGLCSYSGLTGEILASSKQCLTQGVSTGSRVSIGINSARLLIVCAQVLSFSEMDHEDDRTKTTTKMSVDCLAHVVYVNLLSLCRAVHCNNQRYSWVTCFILSNICNFSQLVLSILSTHPLFALSIFVTLSIFRRLIKLLSSSRALLSIHL